MLGIHLPNSEYEEPWIEGYSLSAIRWISQPPELVKGPREESASTDWDRFGRICRSRPSRGQSQSLYYNDCASLRDWCHVL